jgi:hypothetical protein
VEKMRRDNLNRKCNPREGWAEASRALSVTGDDALIWPEFPNEHDAHIVWDVQHSDCKRDEPDVK